MITFVTNSGSQSKISAGRISLCLYQPLGVVFVLFQDDLLREIDPMIDNVKLEYKQNLI